MSRGLVVALALVVSALAVGGGILLSMGLREAQPDAESVRALTSAPFTTLQGESRTLGAFSEKILVINFWATWCAPCKEEIPGLIAVQRELPPEKATIVGIAVDSATKVAEYAASAGFNYPILVGNAQTLDLLRRLGNQAGGLPYTVFVSPNGEVFAQHLGLISPEGIRAKLKGRLG